jgi:hypothetical protein
MCRLLLPLMTQSRHSLVIPSAIGAFFEQGINDGAFRNFIVGATLGHMQQYTFHALKVRNLLFHIFDMIERQSVYFCARKIAPINKTQQTSNFLKTKPEFSAPADKRQPL